MALKHVKKYYNEVEETYLEMCESAKDFDEALKKGEVTQEQFDQASAMYLNMKQNYERISYIMYLFMRPAKSSKGKKFDKSNSKALSYLNSVKADQKSIYEEDRDALKKFKEFVRGLNQDGSK